MGKRLTPLVALCMSQTMSKSIKLRLHVYYFEGGGIAGMTYGMFAVRQKLFLDLLSIPDDRSPFAYQARRM